MLITPEPGRQAEPGRACACCRLNLHELNQYWWSSVGIVISGRRYLRSKRAYINIAALQNWSDQPAPENLLFRNAIQSSHQDLTRTYAYFSSHTLSLLSCTSTFDSPSRLIFILEYSSCDPRLVPRQFLVPRLLYQVLLRLDDGRECKVC
jgi:hypothetical protein